jgi:hypothetical protein
VEDKRRRELALAAMLALAESMLQGAESIPVRCCKPVFRLPCTRSLAKSRSQPVFALRACALLAEIDIPQYEEREESFEGLLAQLSQKLG